MLVYDDSITAKRPAIFMQPRRAVPTPWRSFVRAFGLFRFANRRLNLFYDFNLHKQPLPDGPIEVEAISGACMLVKCEVVLDVGR